MGLPACIVKLCEIDSLAEGLGSICSINAEAVINLESLVQNPSEEISSTCRPLDLGSTWGFALSNFSLTMHIPEVHLTFRNVAESSEHQEIIKWTNTDGVSESFSIFTGWLTVFIVHGWRSWLLSRDNKEVFSTIGPFNILDLIIEDGDE